MLLGSGWGKPGPLLVNWAIVTLQWALKQAGMSLVLRKLSVSWEWCGNKTWAGNTEVSYTGQVDMAVVILHVHRVGQS